MTVSAASSRVAALAVGAALLVGACGPAAPSVPSSGGVTASAGPSTAPGASDQAPAPSGTPWPGDVPDAIIGLGAIDAQLAAAGQAMDAAITAKDVEAMAAAANGLVKLIDENARFVAIAQGYAGTKALADAYAGAFEKMRAGASGISGGATAGDATRLDAGVQSLAEGITAYGLARRGLAPLLEQAIAQKKMYVK